MKVAEIQKSIIDQIRTLEDPQLLKAIQSLIAASKTEEKYQLNEEQKKSVEISRKQIENGEYKDQKEFMTEVRSWLKEK
ncbi:hypothetical protein [Salibacter halophilus]|uniref:Addiction module protein n=1 Tax=Salibacter halophilus TaxID=1803916 RepID=A0A6N6MB12_9FLAO|nr:hypothetical protein [Salibacter halophilus]KAB1066036.1 hypothetical protein F3059_00785 [Salibacter halophilus]